MTVAPAAVVVETLGYQLIARAAKAGTMASFLHQGGLPSSDAELMTPECGGNSQGLEGQRASWPAQLCAERRDDHATLAELRKLEQLIPTCGAVRISRLPEAA